MLSFALVFTGTYDGETYIPASDYEKHVYRELRPISETFEAEALAVNGLDRNRLMTEGSDPAEAMTDVARWVQETAGIAKPVLVAYPLSFDWSWLYWYFIRYSRIGSPFEYSRCFDIKTAVSVKSKLPISSSGRSRLPRFLVPKHMHTHHALDDAIEQAEIFTNIFQWAGNNE
jgi:hypothetical protein